MDATAEFQVKIAKNFDGKTFALFIKYLNELKKDVIEYNEAMEKDLTPDMFLIFLDKIRSLTHSEHLNEMIMNQLSGVNIDMVQTKTLMNTY